MIKLFELAIFIMLAIKAGKYLFGKQRHKSIVGKITLLISRNIHKKLDKSIKTQAEKYGIKTNVIPFKSKRRVN